MSSLSCHDGPACPLICQPVADLMGGHQSHIHTHTHTDQMYRLKIKYIIASITEVTWRCQTHLSACEQHKSKLKDELRWNFQGIHIVTLYICSNGDFDTSLAAGWFIGSCFINEIWECVNDSGGEWVSSKLKWIYWLKKEIQSFLQTSEVIIDLSGDNVSCTTTAVLLLQMAACLIWLTPTLLWH